MATFTSVKQLVSANRKRLKNYRKGAIKSAKQAAEFGKKEAMKMAAQKSGATKRGIRVRKSKKLGYSLESWVPGTFKQNMFQNQTAPFRTVRFKTTSRQPFYATPQSVVYGGAAISPSGNPIRWTGVARFFHFATLRTRAKFPSIVRKNTSKALRVGIA